MKLTQTRLFGFEEGEKSQDPNNIYLQDFYATTNPSKWQTEDLTRRIEIAKETWAKHGYHSFYVESWEIDTEGKEFIETLYGGRYVKEFDQLNLLDGRKAEVFRIGKRGKVYINIFKDNSSTSVKRFDVPLSNRLDEQGEWTIRS